MAKPKPLPSQAEIKTILHYDPMSGAFRWRLPPTFAHSPWDLAGCKTSNGYIRIRINNVLHYAHRLAWMYVHGCNPTSLVDHIDRNPQNNALQNLRLATPKQNNENTSINTKNTSGFRGVSFNKQRGKWSAYVKHNGKKHHLGLFLTAQDAAIAAKQKRLEIFTHETKGIENV